MIVHGQNIPGNQNRVDADSQSATLASFPSLPRKGGGGERTEKFASWKVSVIAVWY
jgi:hypothetical protein